MCTIASAARRRMGVDYQSIGNTVALPAGVVSNSITIWPINQGQTSVETVVIDLCPSPMLTPVNYIIGSPSNAVVYISPGSSTPPSVRMVNPTNGAIYQAPVNIPLLAQANDLGGTISNVEFFAGSTDLGSGQLLVLDPPGVNGTTGPVYFLNWSNVPPNTYSLSAVATDNGGSSITSAPVAITVLGSTSNTAPIVRITSPPNGATFRAPLNVPIISYAADLQSYIVSVQFLEDGNSLGFGRPITATTWAAQGANYVGPTNLWAFVWTSPPPRTNIALTAVATDDSGLSSTSAPVVSTFCLPCRHLRIGLRLWESLPAIQSPSKARIAGRGLHLPAVERRVVVPGAIGFRQRPCSVGLPTAVRRLRPLLCSEWAIRTAT